MVSCPLSAMLCGTFYLEGKMLEEMCGAIGPVCLCSASGINPHTNRRGLRPRRVFGSDLPAHQYRPPDK